jgi:FAD/FMN-containing dehydrogenase
MNSSRMTIDGLKSLMRGEIILPDSALYDAARSLWNGMIDRRPAVILRCMGVADVRRAVDFARDNHMMLSVRASGHNIAGNAVCDGGMVIDLSQMKSARIDPVARRAYVEPGCTLYDYDCEAQAFGLATPLGINSTTGVAGLTLGGGFGWLTRKFGMSVDNLVSADVVTADGNLLHCSANSHEDLFWAIRGGGGNFGVVTMFEFQVHPVGPEIYAGLTVLPIEQARDALIRYRAVSETWPDELSVWAVARICPPLPFLSDSIYGKPVIIFGACYSGQIDNGPGVIGELCKFGIPHGEQFGRMAYIDWQRAFDPLLTPGARNYWKSHAIGAIDDGLIDAYIDAIAHLPSPQSEMVFASIGGQAGRVASDATAYVCRDAKYMLSIHGRWNESSDDGHCVAGVRAIFEKFSPFALGSVYVNFLGEDETDRVKAAYGQNYARLVAVKDRYDPGNLFRHNQNIKPSSSRSTVA